MAGEIEPAGVLSNRQAWRIAGKDLEPIGILVFERVRRIEKNDVGRMLTDFADNRTGHD